MTTTPIINSGTQFPLEAQLVHFKSDYGSIEEALNEPDGIAILVALFQVKAHLNWQSNWQKNIIRLLASSLFIQKKIEKVI